MMSDMLLPRAKLRRRLIAGVTLLAYLVAAIGFPVPESAAQSTHACGQQVCGCGTAEQCKSGGCCCSHKLPEAPPEEEEPADCCTKKKPADSCCTKDKKTPAKSKSNTVRWVVGISALKCKGGATQWLSADAALPMQAPLSWSPSWPYCHSLPIDHEHPITLSEDRLDPPPRVEAD